MKGKWTSPKLSGSRREAQSTNSCSNRATISASCAVLLCRSTSAISAPEVAKSSEYGQPPSSDLLSWKFLTTLALTGVSRVASRLFLMQDARNPIAKAEWFANLLTVSRRLED
jgi:hypothetical protein